MDAISNAVELIEQATSRFKTNFGAVPKEKLAWSPSPQAKTPMQILAHSAVAAGFFKGLIAGKSSTLSAEQAGQAMDSAEAELTNPTEALKMLDDTTKETIDIVRKLTPSDLNKVVKAPFREAPVLFWMNLYSRHLDMHCAQLEYLQTCWGDMEFHNPTT